MDTRFQFTGFVRLHPDGVFRCFDLVGTQEQQLFLQHAAVSSGNFFGVDGYSGCWMIMLELKPFVSTSRCVTGTGEYGEPGGGVGAPNV